MKQVGHQARDVAGAREEIFSVIQMNPNNNIIIYFDGWDAFGAAAVLRSIAQSLPSMKSPPPKLCFGRIICIDCSRWTSKRVMQRKIAEELKLDWKTMAMFEEQDEEDDFNGVDLGSRDVIRGVAAVIDRTLRESRFMIIFINGSDDELDLNRFGIPGYLDCVIVWTFSTSLVSMNFHSTHVKMVKKLRYTDVLLYCYISGSELRSQEFLELFREEAAHIVAPYYPCMWGMDLPTVVDCCLYGLVLYHRYRSTTGFVWSTHAPSYWVCDGIIQGDRAWEISTALHPAISFECDDRSLDGVLRKLKEDPETPFVVLEEAGYMDFYGPYHWISITKNNRKENKDIQTVMERASSIFLEFETMDYGLGLPSDCFKCYDRLSVLVLTRCAFSFVSPVFLHCHTLRFLGLEHCTSDSSSIEHQEGDSTTKWAFLNSLWVLSLYYTDWAEILSDEKIELMANLMELNIEGVGWPWLTGHHLQKRLPWLQRLRIIRPVYNVGMTSTNTCNSFVMNNTSLEMLDLSGCDGVEYVELSNNSLLKSFSFDGYWPASHQTLNGNGVAKTSMISLAGCTRLDNLFLHGLRNLEELDLSGCAIKVLDFGSMVLDVPMLKRLFLLGCEHLRAINWGSSSEQRPELLELICIDTRPGSGRVCSRAPSLGTQQKSIQLQVHAITTDARLARSLWYPIAAAMGNATPGRHSPPHALYFNVSITSWPSDTCGVVQLEATPISNKEMVGSSSDQGHFAVAAAAAPLIYGDVFIEVGDGLTPMQAFPQAPTGPLNRHVEIGEGSRNVQSETEAVAYNTYNLAELMGHYTESLHVHDVSTCISVMPAAKWYSLRWCRIERCPNLHAVFLPSTEEFWGKLETIWASDLLMARSIWSKFYVGYSNERFKSLRHLHLRRCLSLRFALAMGLHPSFLSLETLHIIHCGDLKHVFVPGDEQHQHTSVEFPKLTTIHLHDLPALQQVCEAAEMVAPALETIVVRGCPNLRRLPALKGRELGMRKPTVEIEKDVWDALEWDGVGAGHHPSLYAAPVHSRYYKRRFIRRTVLR